MAANTIPESDEVALTEIRELEERTGSLPGRNQLMSELDWGASRSTRLLNLYKEQTGRADEASPSPTRSVRPAPVDRQANGEQTASSGPDRAPSARQSPPADRQTTGAVNGQSPTRSAPSGRGQSTQVDQPSGPRKLTPVRPAQSWESIRSTVDSLQRDQAQTPDQADQTEEYKTPYGLIIATLVISLSAFTAVWGGWVGLGRMVGFGPVNLLPGIGTGLTVDLAITLPLGIEAYAAAALWVAVGGLVHGRGRWFAGLSAGVALGLGAFGQATYHLLDVQGRTVAPDWVVIFVSVLPVIVLGAAGVLLHLVLEERKRRARR